MGLPPLALPASFDSARLDSTMRDWICALREFSVEALVVMGL